MHARFYAPDLEAGAATVELPIDEARHLLRVMRLRAGASVRVFNGRGVECAGRVAGIDRDHVTVAIDCPVDATPECSTHITLAQAVLKGDGMDGVVRDAVMLGVARLVPLLSAHVEGDRRGHQATLRVGRWERIAVSSAKQCGRAVVPAIAQPASLAACLSELATGLRIALVEPASAGPSFGLRALPVLASPPEMILFVGPEGGWADDELRLLAGYQAYGMTLGRRTLRADAAAIVGISALHALWGEFGSRP